MALKNPVLADLQPSFGQGSFPGPLTFDRTTPGWVIEKWAAYSGNTSVTEINEMSDSRRSSSSLIEENLVDISIIDNAVDNHERDSVFFQPHKMIDWIVEREC